MIELIETNYLVSCIYDIRKLKSLPPLDQDWFIDVVLPQLSRTSIRKVAVLESLTSNGLLDLNQLVYTRHYSIPFELQYFEDVATALEWISRPLEARHQSAMATHQNVSPLF
ncbi:hypothetical protein [Rufibacter latericius]|uniref:STAS/SEC14 domain-containing protein n=1 Tax=Rufibacter latericius TaxID=2487040 RepID=A0A3M9MF42_9BACT|nr:hypothetical protein [Rufibacter latericius]RNI23473.1 hypothetical protein EFB08_18215 [Rufibacter latericius]